MFVHCLLFYFSYNWDFIEEHCTDISVLNTWAPTLKSYTVFMCPKLWRAMSVSLWTVQWCSSLKRKTSHNKANAQHLHFHQLTVLYYMQHILKISIFQSTLWQQLGKWTAITTGAVVLPGTWVTSGFLGNGSARNVRPDVTETVSDINAQLKLPIAV